MTDFEKDKTTLIPLLAQCLIEYADPDGGIEYATKFATEEVESFSEYDVRDWIEAIDAEWNICLDRHTMTFYLEEPRV